MDIGQVHSFSWCVGFNGSWSSSSLGLGGLKGVTLDQVHSFSRCVGFNHGQVVSLGLGVTPDQAHSFSRCVGLNGSWPSSFPRFEGVKGSLLTKHIVSPGVLD